LTNKNFGAAFGFAWIVIGCWDIWKICYNETAQHYCLATLNYLVAVAPASILDHRRFMSKCENFRALYASTLMRAFYVILQSVTAFLRHKMSTM